MTYQKTFFVAVAGCSALFWAALVLALHRRLSGPALAGIVGLASLHLAVLGRISNGLATKASRLLGNCIQREPFTSIARSLLRLNLRPAEMEQTDSGQVELTRAKYHRATTLNRLREQGLPITPLQLDVPGFEAYWQKSAYSDHHPNYYRGKPYLMKRKAIQHYVSLMLTPISPGITWMDVASSSSPFPEIAARLHGIRVYRQDLSYPPGIQGLQVGSNAARIPLPDACLDRVSLHCSFEHFSGESDQQFIPELARLLRPGGLASIVPLYLADTYQIVTNPALWLRYGIPREEGAQITLSRTYWEHHGRFYDAETLQRRVLQPLRQAGLQFELFEISVPAEWNYPSFMGLRISKP